VLHLIFPGRSAARRFRPLHAIPVRNRLRQLVFGGLVLSWSVMLVRMWSAFWRLPSPELLERQRMVRPPTFASLRWEIAQSAVELVILGVLLWPGWRRFYLLRLLTAGIGTLAWFLLTPPLAITSVQRVHRTWLALVGASLVLLAVFGMLWAGGMRFHGWVRSRR
jgi:hypothetical protein